MLNNEAQAGYTIKFSSTARIQITLSHYIVNLLFPFTFIDDLPLPAGIYRYDQSQIRFQSDQRRLFSLIGGVSYGTFYNGM